jgi:predicted metal-dependent hydrolase
VTDQATERVRRNPYAGLPTTTKRRTGPYVTRRCGDPPPAELLHGIEQFNRGEFFEQHETLEGLWRTERDDVRYLYQGILLVGVGCYHLLRGNRRGATAKLQAGIAMLEWFRPVCQGVAVDELIAAAQRLLDAVGALGPDGPAEVDRSLLPRVRLVGAPARPAPNPS